MLTDLTIQNFALVDKLALELDIGMTAITGETGAGKSIMLDALGLTLGDRADLDVIRTGFDRADISAAFAIAQNPLAQHWLLEHDIPDAEDQVLLRRVLTRDGRSRAYINGQPTTLNELKALGEMLIDIHSQHEHQSLLHTLTHQRLLDAYGGCEALSRDVRERASEIKKLSAQITSLQADDDGRNARRELLSFQVKELEELRPQPDEFASLEQELAQLSHAEEALAALQVVRDLCSENDEFNTEAALRRACGLLEDMPFSNSLLDEATAMLNTALIQVEEASSTLLRASDKIELNPERLQEVDERLGSIHRLARKHKVDPHELHALAQELSEQLQQLDSADSNIEKLQASLLARQNDYHAAAAKLSKNRNKAATKLDKEINQQLARLGMAAARFQVALNTSKANPISSTGYESAEFLVSTNPGNPPKPMVKIASGGELSRISLAIQVVIAKTMSIPTLVFDEVDVGIGGGTARAVGELLRELGDRGQVLCVTHQPQVASQAHQHLLVSKAASKDGTSTSLKKLDQDQRVKEIARMLAGDDLTDNSLAHARELLA